MKAYDFISNSLAIFDDCLHAVEQRLGVIPIHNLKLISFRLVLFDMNLEITA